MIRVTNPILARELKERMRTLRAPVVLTVYLLVLGLVAFAVERVLSTESGFDPLAAAGIGRAVFYFLLFFTLMLICFLVPGFTAASVTGERERQTFPLLQVTLLRPRSIVLGKLFSSLAFMMLLILATLPLMSISFILGGVTPLDVLRGYGMVILTGFTIAMAGIALSSLLRRTVSATVLAYALVGVLTLGTVASYALTRAVVVRRGGNPSGHVWGLVVNPFLGTASALRGSGAAGGPSSPFSSLFNFLGEPQFAQTFEGRAFAVPFGGGPVPVPVAPNVDTGGPPDVTQGGFPGVQQVVRPPRRLPVWAGMVIWYGAISILCYLVAVAGVRAPSRGLSKLLGRRVRSGET